MNAGTLPKLLPLFAIIAAATLCLAVAPMAETDAADVPDVYDDLGQQWTYRIGLQYDGNQAATVTWDFGDGSEPVTGFYVEHTYENAGTYYIKQTATNDLGSPEAWFKVQIMGFPTITFDSMGGSDVDTITVEDYGAKATAPEAPVMDGYTFAGWYLDKDCKDRMNWNLGITKPLNLYASWVSNEVALTEYTVKYDAGGFGTFEDAKGTVNTNVTLPTPADRDGYVFDGWYDGEERVGGAGEQYSVYKDVTLKAQWSVAGEDDKDDSGDGDGGIDYVAIIAIVAGIIVAVIALILFKPAVIIGLILIVVGALKFGGVF